MSLRLTSLLAAVFLLTLAPAALAADPPAADAGPISVKVNMARIVKINAPAATVIIGNPGVADVTIQDPQTLVLTGKSYGQTNLIVLDSGGNAIADTLVTVVQGQSDLVTMFVGASKQTVVCTPKCQPVLMLGDDPTYMTTTQSASTILQSAAGH